MPLHPLQSKQTFDLSDPNQLRSFIRKIQGDKYQQNYARILQAATSASNQRQLDWISHNKELLSVSFKTKNSFIGWLATNGPEFVRIDLPFQNLNSVQEEHRFTTSNEDIHNSLFNESPFGHKETLDINIHSKTPRSYYKLFKRVIKSVLVQSIKSTFFLIAVAFVLNILFRYFHASILTEKDQMYFELLRHILLLMSQDVEQDRSS